MSADRAEAAFAEAARPGSGAGALEGVVADAARLPFPDASVDLHVSFETIEHIPDDRAAVREARRVLAPGGFFLCSTPEREVISPGRTLADRPDNPYHEREYSQAEFAALLAVEFPKIEWFGQTQCGDGHQQRLAALARLSPAAARKLHQARNLAFLPAGSARHAPYPLAGARGRPEVLIAVCGPV